MSDNNSYYYQNMMQSFQETEYMRQQFTAFNGLNGSLKEDGELWAAITGEMPEHFIAGFGKTPAEAMADWYRNYFTQKARPNKA